MVNDGCIVAQHTGMMIAARLVSETRCEWCVEYRDTNIVRNIPKSSKTWQVFPNTKQAEAWISKQK